MIFLPLKEVSRRTSLSPTEIRRREELGTFPKRHRLSSGTNRKGRPTGRIYWTDVEVDEWQADQLR